MSKGFRIWFDAWEAMGNEIYEGFMTLFFLHVHI
jgi:hypothetical protein